MSKKTKEEIKAFENQILASIFHFAADHCLSNTSHTNIPSEKDSVRQYGFSCDAVSLATQYLRYSSNSGKINVPVKIPLEYSVDTVFTFLKKAGLNVIGIRSFDEFPEGETRQSVRYAWLKFCALLAEEGAI